MKWTATILVLPLISLGCTIKVEPLPKKRPVVVRHVHHYHGKLKQKQTQQQGSSLQSKRYPTMETEDRLIEPEPKPTP